MGIFNKSAEAAQVAVTKAESVVRDWEVKAADARAEAARLDAESGAAILEDETAAERITLNVQAHERKARAYDGAATEARQKLYQARREALEVEAREEDALAAADQKASAAHLAKLEDLKRQLEALDGCEWERANGDTGKEGQLAFSAHRHQTRAGAVRYYLATGDIPYDFYMIDKQLGTSLHTLASFTQGDYIPASLTAAREAGPSFAG